MLNFQLSLTRSKRLLAAVIAVGCLAAGVLIHQFYRAQWNALSEEKGSELMVIAQAKAAAIASWRKERFGDIEAVSANTALARSVRDALAEPWSARTQAEIRGWLQNLDSPDDDCTVQLFDLSGRQRFSSAQVQQPVAQHGQRLAMEAARQGRVLVSDLHLESPGSVQIAAAAPLLEENGRVLAAVSIHIDPRPSLYPMIQTWPMSSRTGESLLVRRDGAEVTFLNELRHKKGAALTLKAPLSSPDLPAAIAVQGREGVVEGVDYRGEDVLAALKRVPDSPWFLVAKMDAAEIRELAQARTAYFAAVTVLVTIVCGFSLMLAWSRGESRHYLQMYQAETQHRAVVSHYEEIHQHANDIMLLVDEAGRIIEANERAVQNYGYPRAALLAMNIRDLREPSSLMRLDEQWRAAESAGGVLFETTHRRADGSTFPVEVSSRVIRVDTCRYRQSIVRDISERKRVERELLDAHNRLQTAMEIAGLGPAEFDTKTGILSFSPRACAIFGFDHGNQTHATWLERIHPEDRDSVWTEVRAAMQDGTASFAEYRIVRPDGSIRWASAKGIAVSAPDGSKKRFIVTQDITDRRLSEQALRESEERFRAAFEHAAMGMLVVDAGGALRSVNQTLCEMLQYPAGELIGKHFQDITHPDDREVGADVARRLLAGELTHAAFEKRYLRKDGSVLWALVSSAVLRKRPGSAPEFITQIQDVTERKFAEASLRDKSARLEELTGALSLSHAIVTRPDGVVRHWSRGAMAMYGWSAEEAVGRSVTELLRTEFPHPQEAIQAQLKSTGEWEGELRQHRSDGEAVVVASHWSLQRDEHGQPAAIIEVDNDITSLKRTEEALQVAHRDRELYLVQLEAVLNHLTEGIVVSDLRGNLIHWNPAALQLHGFSSLDECRRHVAEFADLFEVVTDEGPQPVENWPIPRILRGETLRGYEVRLRSRAGSWERAFSYAGSLARDGNGQPFLAVLSITDVTAARAAEAALREREADLNRAQAVAKMGSWRFDGRTRELRCSDETYRLFGVPVESSISLDAIFSFVHPDDRAMFGPAVTAGLPEERFDLEFRILVGGGVKWVRAHGELHVGPAGEVTGGFGTVQDITRTREEEDALKQALAEAEAGRRLLNAMMEHIPLGIAVSDARDSAVVYVSRYARELEQGSSQETSVSGAWHAPGKPGAPASDEEMPLARARMHGEVVREEEWLLTRSDGVTLPILATAAPIRDADGRIIGAVAAWQDISERKRAEVEIRQLNSELEQRVRERTAELQAANKELEAFSYSVSHDLRAPLRGIDGWSLALLEDYGQVLDSQARQYLDRVRAETQRMGMLIDDLLQLSRVTRAQMRRNTVDLSSLALRVADKVQENHDGRRIQFVVTPGLKAEGDEGLLEVTLTNLFDNAAKFTAPRAEARIEFGASRRNEEAAFYVRDNGVGFDMAYADKLFGAFQRLHKASEFPGTGIGLATVQRVVRRHGGRIWAESQSGDGATFYFTLGSRNEN